MKATTKRNIFRWIHIGLGSIIATYIYSPWSQIPTFQLATKAVIIPLTILSGIWLWKGHLIKKHVNKSNAFGLVLLLFFGAAVVGLMSFRSNDEPTLILKINNVKKDGIFHISFCTTASEWTENGKYTFKFKAIKGQQNEFKINTLPKGNYSTALFLDLNGNGQLDANLFGIPKEPYGFSNNPSSRFSKPSFEECNFSFSQTNQSVEINL
jgi:uncharacterized protein (DUF2141 family)